MGTQHVVSPSRYITKGDPPGRPYNSIELSLYLFALLGGKHLAVEVRQVAPGAIGRGELPDAMAQHNVGNNAP